jgi:hypothetical protein
VTWAAVGSELNSTSNSTFSLTPHNAGDLILLEVVGENTTVLATALASSNVTWAPAGTSFTGAIIHYTGAVFAGTVTSTGTATVTITWNGTAPTARTNGQEFSSTAGSWAFDTQGNLDNTGTNTWPSLTPAVNGELYFGWAEDSGTAAAGSTSGYTYISDAQGNGLAYNLSCPAGVATAPVWGDSGLQFGVMVLMKETGAAFVPAPNLPRGQAVNRASTY